MEKVLFVVNLISGDKDKSLHIEEVRAYAGENDFFIEKYETTGENDSENIEKLIKNSNISRIVVSGGDGTIKLIAGLLLKHPELSMGILPGGSSNGLAKSLSIPENYELAIPIAFGDNIEQLDVIEINGEHCLHLSDAGFNAEMIEKYEESDQRGFLGYAKEIVNTIKNYSGDISFELKINGEEKFHKAKMLVIGNAQKYGFGGLINPNGDVQDGKFELIVIRRMGLEQITKMMAGAQEEDYHPADVEMYQSSEAFITFREPSHFQIDGEYMGKLDQLNIKMCDCKVRVLMPKEEN